MRLLCLIAATAAVRDLNSEAAAAVPKPIAENAADPLGPAKVFQNLQIDGRPIIQEALQLPAAKVLFTMQDPEQRQAYGRALESLVLTQQQQDLMKKAQFSHAPSQGDSSLFTVFDCEDSRSVHRAFSLIEPQECEPLRGRHGNPVEANVQVVRTNIPLSVEAYACRIVTTRTVTKCGFTSLHYGSVEVESGRVHPMTPQKCRGAVVAQTVKFEGHVLPVVIGGSRTMSFFQHGGIDVLNGHYCTNSDFIFNGKMYKGSYMTVAATVTIEQLHGLYTPATGRVRFSNHIVANYMDQVVEDDVYGSISWTAQKFSCAERMSNIFNGSATLHPIANASVAGNVGDLILIKEPENNRFAGLVLKGSIDTCGARLFKTQLNDILVQILRPGEEAVPAHFIPWGEAETASLASNLGFIHLDRALAQDKRFLEVRDAICENERKFIAAQLAMSASHSSYALIHTHGVGHVLTRAGSVVHITACTPRMAKYRAFPNCTQEIPIQMQNETAFADPLTWVIQRYPTVVPCDRITPIMWMINGRWMCAHPEPTPCTAPAIMSPGTNDGLDTLHDFTHGLGGSIFSIEQRRQHRLAMELASSREATVTEFTRRAIRRAEEYSTGALGSFIDDADLKELTRRVASKIMPFFGLVGEYWVAITGILVTITILKVLIGCTARMFLTYRVHGCGWWVICSIWHTAFTILHTFINLTTAAARHMVNRPQLDDDPNQPRNPDPTGPADTELTDVVGETRISRSESRYRTLQESLDAVRTSQDRIAAELRGSARPANLN